MKLYFKHDAESDLGTGTAYIDVTDSWPSRQIEICGETWRWGDEAHNEWLADQPLDALDLGEADAISAEEFEQAWQEAQRRCPHTS